MSKKTKSKVEGKDIGLFQKILYILDKKQRAEFLGLGILILIGGILETMGVSMLLPIVTAVTDPETIRSAIDGNAFLRGVTLSLGLTDDRKILLALLWALIIIYIVKNTFLVFSVYRQNTVITRAQNNMISRVMREFLNRPYEEYLGADIPTVFRITDSDIPQTFSLLLALLSLATELVVSAFLCLYLLLIVSAPITVFVIVIFGAMTLLNSKVLKKRLNDVGRRNQAIQSRIAKWRIQAIYGLKDVKVLNRQDFFIRNYYESGKIGAQTARTYAVLNNLPRLMIETVFMVSIMGFFIVYIMRGGNMMALFTQLTAFAMAAVRIMPSANRINTYMTQIAYQEPSLNFVYDNLTESMKLEGQMRAVTSAATGPALTLEDKIEMNHITFRYPGGERNIFTDASMVIPKGKSVGIMGPSGAGKSTIVDILLGLLHASEGEILCDGRSIFSNYDSWLSMVGYIPQSIYLVDESIRDNIAFGIDADRIDEKRIWEVCDEAQLTAFIKSLPEGLDTKIGDRGVRLSGGQRQRIGIARALYADPEVLVFDEATSALDGDTEAAVMDAINSFHGRKTMVIIAHRLNTIADCDLIYEVEDETIRVTSLEGRVLYREQEAQ